MLLPPFTKVSIKRVQGEAEAHHLLAGIVGREVTGMPEVFGYSRDGDACVYFFQNSPATYRLLEEEIKQKGVDSISSQIIRTIVKQAADTFKCIAEHGYVYIDFCAKNIMIDHRNRRVILIDIDSSWPMSLLKKKGKPDRQVQVEFWGLWNEDIGSIVPINVENAPKTLVLSFAAVWSRALILGDRKTNADDLTALKLVHNPSINYQRPLWKALRNKSSHEFMEYCHLKGTLGETVYEQWQDMFGVLRSGRELPWHAVISATDNLLSAIEGAQAQSTGPPVPDVPESRFVRYRTGLVVASGLVVMVLVTLVTWGAIREQSPDTVPIVIAEQCTFAISTGSGQATGTLYNEKSANRARADFYTTDQGITQGDHFIMYPGWFYAWQDDGKAGIAVEVIANADPKRLFNPLTKFKCDSWTPTNTPFILPDGIMYRSLSREEAMQYFESRDLPA
jgi:hypothetical protein